MNIGIIIYSLTGNTFSVAEKLQAALTAQGHTVELKRVTVVNETPNSRNNIALENTPSITAYDAVIFGAPVHGYSLSPVMSLYLKQLQALTGKEVAGFVTEHFPKPWMGGNHAIKQMVRLITQKGGMIMDTGVVNWTNRVREEQIKDIVVRFCKTI